MNNIRTTQVNQQWLLEHITPKNTNKCAYYNRHWYDKQVWRKGETLGVWSSDVGKEIKLYATTITVIFISLSYIK